MRTPATVPRMLRLPGAREAVRSLRNRVDSERSNGTQSPAIVALRRPKGTHGPPTAAESTRTGPPERPGACTRAQPAPIENP